MTSSSDPFDRVFESVLAEGVVDEHGSPSPALPDELERQLRQSLQHFADGHYVRARDGLGGVMPFADADPRISALAAACESLLSGRLQPGLQACMQLLERKSHLPDLYAILGMLLLRSRQRAEAHAIFMEGLRMDPVHRPLQTGMECMGIRRRPVLRFLPRAHPLNRCFGHLRAWAWSRPFHPGLTAPGTDRTGRPGGR